MTVFENPTEMWNKLHKSFLLNENFLPLDITGVSANLYSEIYKIESFKADKSWNISEMGYSINKWKRLIKGYLDPESYNNMVTRAKEFYDKHNCLKPVGMVFYGSKVKMIEKAGIGGTSNGRGPCLLSLSLYRFKGNKVKVTIHQRTMEMTRRLYVDHIFIYKILEGIGKVANFKPEDCEVTWIIDHVYQNIYEAMLFFYKNPDFIPIEANTKYQERFLKEWEGFVNKKETSYHRRSSILKAFHNPVIDHKLHYTKLRLEV